MVAVDEEDSGGFQGFADAGERFAVRLACAALEVGDGGGGHAKFFRKLRLAHVHQTTGGAALFTGDRHATLWPWRGIFKVVKFIDHSTLSSY